MHQQFHYSYDVCPAQHTSKVRDSVPQQTHRVNRECGADASGSAECRGLRKAPVSALGCEQLGATSRTPARGAAPGGGVNEIITPPLPLLQPRQDLRPVHSEVARNLAQSLIATQHGGIEQAGQPPKVAASIGAASGPVGCGGIRSSTDGCRGLAGTGKALTGPIRSVGSAARNLNRCAAALRGRR